jgi:hypothetical protein
MTIGIAAFGPEAGLAVIRALAAVEAVGRGAIGGYVAYVALLDDGRLVRAETQRGGTASLFGNGAADIPGEIASAHIAGLMSSGPDRPEPLSQFVPAAPGVGLVTGHRMPNTIGRSGVNVNDEVLALMSRGVSVAEAVDAVAAQNPDVDAGFIALSMDGSIHARNTEHVARKGDVGSEVMRGGAGDPAVAVLHNGIKPFRPLALLAASIAMDAMVPPDRPNGWITFRKGVPLVLGAMNAVEIGEDRCVERIILSDAKFVQGTWSLGLGYEISVLRDGKARGVMLYEPYMVVSDGRLQSLDGHAEMTIPVRGPSL